MCEQTIKRSVVIQGLGEQGWLGCCGCTLPITCSLCREPLRARHAECGVWQRKEISCSMLLCWIHHAHDCRFQECKIIIGHQRNLLLHINEKYCITDLKYYLYNIIHTVPQTIRFQNSLLCLLSFYGNMMCAIAMYYIPK